MWPNWWKGVVPFEWTSWRSLCWLYLSPKGRLPRREAFLGSVLLIIFGFVNLFLLTDPMTELELESGSAIDGSAAALLAGLLLIQLLIVIGLTNVLVKRFHDFDWRGVACALPLLPLLLLTIPGEKFPSGMQIGFFCLFLLASLVALGWIAVQSMSEGSHGQNRFGPPFGTRPTEAVEISGLSANAKMEAYIVELVGRGYPEQEARDYVLKHADRFE